MTPEERPSLKSWLLLILQRDLKPLEDTILRTGLPVVLAYISYGFPTAFTFSSVKADGNDVPGYRPQDFSCQKSQLTMVFPGDVSLSLKQEDIKLISSCLQQACVCLLETQKRFRELV